MDQREEEFDATLTSQGELVGSVSHDIKGLLSGIDGGIYLVDSGLKKKKQDRVEQGFEMVKRNLARIRRTVANILYYVKDREIDWEPLKLEGLTESVSTALADHAAHLGVSLQVKADAGTFEGGELPIQALLSNLVEYALEACQLAKASSNLSVTLEAGLGAEHAEFQISAEGFAMGQDTLDRARSAYYSPKGADRSHLGLFIVNKLVKFHQGTLEIKASPDQGSTRIFVRLPRTRPSETA